MFALGLNSGAFRLKGDVDKIFGVISGIADDLLVSGTAIDGVKVTDLVRWT